MIYDENSNTNATKRSRYSTRSKTAKMGLRSGGLGGSRRTALGDISNARSDWKTSKGLKKAVGGDTRKVSKPQASRGTAMVTRSGRSAAKKASTRRAPREELDCLSSMEIEEDQIPSLGMCEVDVRDMNDPQLVVEYVHDIMAYLKKIEPKFRAKPTYMTEQQDINARMREILIDWLNEVHLKFKLRTETLYLTINLIDRFLSLRSVSRTKLQLVGCTAMLIASKYEEIYAPEVRDFVYISDRAYSREDILGMETAMLAELKFDLSVAYPLRFLERFTRVADMGPKFDHTAHFLTELTLQKIAFLKFLPSMIAAASVSLSLSIFGQQPWSDLLKRESDFSLKDLYECKSAILKLLLDPMPKYTAVRKKYTLEKYGEVAVLAQRQGAGINLC